MRVRLPVVEDNVTEYLNYIQNAISEQKENIVKEGGITLASLIYNRGHKNMGYDMMGNPISEEEEYLGYGDAPDWSGALLSSGLNPAQHHFTSSKDYSLMEIYWTGMYADYSWWEFRDDEDTTKPPERDYAYFQETGIDPVAKYTHAHHKGYFTEMVNDNGTQNMVEHYIANEYMRILFRK